MEESLEWRQKRENLCFLVAFWRLSFEQRGLAALKSNREASIVKIWLYSAIIAKFHQLQHIMFE